VPHPAPSPVLEDVVRRLAAHRTLSTVPRAELEWLAAHGTMRHYKTGDKVAITGQTPRDMIVLLSGRIAGHLQRDTGHRHMFEISAGDVTGVLPYSRMTTWIGDILAEEPAEVFAIDRIWLPDMIRECPSVITTLVHIMIDRVRQFVATDWQDEKMASLGRLAAGMAHELNNPASATVRCAQLLTEALTALEQASLALGSMGLTTAQLAAITALRDATGDAAATVVLSSMERVDREDELANWLQAHGAETGLAGMLADGDLTASHLEGLARMIPSPALNTALRWLAAARTARSLSSDIERAGGRIYELVSAVKRFSHMDRATVTEPTNVAQGLADTVSVLSGKAREKDVAVKLHVAANLPLVPAFAAELNQVWSNLMDNALDAAPRGGHVTVSAAQDGPEIIVHVIDDGPGIPADVRSRIFDPFFTTKPVGEGTGLGLDIARRIVRQHNGQIVLDSRPGHTEFRVTIPMTRS
jgi:signal transduction histidine kinase